jgi:hypothetical protein
MYEKVLASTVRIDMTTHDTTGALVAPSSAFANTDFRIYKDGSSAEKTTTNGITVTSPFDSITGKHLIEIDTSNSTGDVGFWAAGSEYRVEVNSAKTVASVVQSGVTVGRFRLTSADALRTDSSSILALMKGIVAGTVSSGSTTTVVNLASTELNLSVSDQVKGRVLIFDKDTASSSLRGQGAPILNSTTTTIIFASGDALTTPPASGDSFTIY